MQKFKTLADAIALAEFAHRNQTDKAGLPYIDHPRRVMETVKSQGALPYVQQAAILHDVTEDTTFTTDMLLALGFSEATVNVVRLVDRDYSEKVWNSLIAQREFEVNELSYHMSESDAYREYDEANFPGPIRSMDKDGFYYYSIANDPGAVQVKKADIADNLSPWRLSYLSEETQTRLKVKYNKALNILDPNRPGSPRNPIGI